MPDMIVPSILCCTGRKFYTLAAMMDEYEQQGVSKRIPPSAIPEGMQPALSKIFVAHPDAIIKVTAPGRTLHDLAESLLEMGLLTDIEWALLQELELPFWTGAELNPGDFVPECMLDISIALSRVASQQHADLAEEFGIQFCMGVAGYAHFQGYQLVLDNDVTELPEEYEHLRPLIEAGAVQPVHVKYSDDDGQPEETDEE